VYGVTGKLAEEYGGPGGAEPLEYVFVDHLGFTRLTAKGDGTVVRRMDYLPGGELLRAGVSGRTAAMGYEAVEDPVWQFEGHILLPPVPEVACGWKKSGGRERRDGVEVVRNK
jgi:hypothetical protein